MIDAYREPKCKKKKHIYTREKSSFRLQRKEFDGLRPEKKEISKTEGVIES